VKSCSTKRFIGTGYAAGAIRLVPTSDTCGRTA
jgi:hypothetical protein